MKRILSLLLAVFLLSACTNHGKKVKSGHIELFYKEGITEDEAQKTAALIEKVDKLAGNDISNKKSFQLIKDKDTTLLRMVVREERQKDVKDEDFIGIANLVSDSIFSGRPVNMDLTDDHFKSFYMVHYKKIDYTSNEGENGFGEKIESGNTEVYTNGASQEEAQKLAAWLNNYFEPASTYSFQLLKDDAGNYTVKMVANPARVNTLGNEFFEPLCQGICDKVLSVPSLAFELTDEKFNKLRGFNYPADTGDPDRNN
jgi:hypothetical protein